MCGLGTLASVFDSLFLSLSAFACAAKAGSSESRMAGCVHDGTCGDGEDSSGELKRDEFEEGEVPREERERGEVGGEETVTERDRCR